MSSSISKASPLPSPFTKEEVRTAQGFLDFVNASPSQFHAVAAAARMLLSAGFVQVSEKNPNWGVKPMGRYFYTRNQSSVVAFIVGGAWQPGSGFAISAAHTDSPVLKLKPVSKVNRGQFLSVGVEPYGGGLWHTWFDRDLGIAGRVIVAQADGSFESRLVHINRPVVRIPNLAIHLNRDVNEKGFIFNKQTHLLPIIATQVGAQLGAKSAGVAGESHHSVLVQLVAAELGVRVEDVRDFELSLCDTQASAFGGAFNEFILSRALDNLCMSYVCTSSLLASAADEQKLAADPKIRIAALFDHEECGSASIMGAGSNNLYQLLNRLNADPASYDAAIANSFLVSADMAHAVHPNYSEMHEENHRPHLHQGLVVKTNQNQRYATSGFSGFLVEELARRHQIPTQKFCVRNDVACGSTIGPILATSCGIRTVDVGVPQLAMHSLREMCGVADIDLAFRLIKAFYEEFAAMDKMISVPGEN